MDILEGRRCVLPALQARQRKIQLVLLKQNAAPTRIAEIVELAESHNVPVKFAPQSEIDALTQGRSHGGIAAICHPKEPLAGKALIELIEKTDEPAFLLLIEGTEDAQNLGYTLRTAEAMGVHAVLLKKHVWSFDSAALSRSSSGAFERLPMVQIEHIERELLPLKKLGIRFYGCIANAKRTLYDVNLTEPALLAIGGERRGLSGAFRQHCDRFVRIPMPQHSATSLSLSQAACVVMAEGMRQRFSLQMQLEMEPPANT